AQTPLTPGATVTGIRFRPGPAANWLGLPMSEIVDRRVDLEDLWGGTARDLAAWLGDAESPAGRLRRLQPRLRRLAGAVDPAAARTPAGTRRRRPPPPPDSSADRLGPRPSAASPLPAPPLPPALPIMPRCRAGAGACPASALRGSSCSARPDSAFRARRPGGG